MKQISSIVLLFILCLLALPVLAQEPELTPEPDPVPVTISGDEDVVLDDTTTPIEEPNLPVSFFMGGTLTLVIVAVLKKVPALNSTPAPALTTVVAFILWAIFQWARARGYAGQFNEISDHLALILPAIVEILLSIFGGTVLFLGFKAAKFPFLGSQRTP